jgi:hypothetical protein
MAKTGEYDIPFDHEGNQQHYPEPSWDKVGDRYVRMEPHWRPNADFAAKLTYVDYSRGRSAAYLNMKDENGKFVTVFMKEFGEMIPHLRDGAIDGIFRFIKRGQNFGCKLVELA